MNHRETLFSHEESLWVVGLTTEAKNGKLPPLAELVDWYNNQLFAKSVLSGHLNLEFGSKSLLSTNGLLPVKRILFVGLGDLKDLTAALARKLTSDLNQTLVDLQEVSPWIIFPPLLPQKFVDELEKSRTSEDTLRHAKLSLD